MHSQWNQDSPDFCVAALTVQLTAPLGGSFPNPHFGLRSPRRQQDGFVCVAWLARTFGLISQLKNVFRILTS